MGFKSTVIVGTVGFGLGAGFMLFAAVSVSGETSAQPEAKEVVKIKEVVKVEYRDKIITTDLPEECTGVSSLLKSVDSDVSAASSSAGKIVLYLSDLTRSKGSGTITEVNNATEKIRTQRDLLDTAAVSALKTGSRLEAAIANCDDAIG